MEALHEALHNTPHIKALRMEALRTEVCTTLCTTLCIEDCIRRIRVYRFVQSLYKQSRYT